MKSAAPHRGAYRIHQIDWRCGVRFNLAAASYIDAVELGVGRLLRFSGRSRLLMPQAKESSEVCHVDIVIRSTREVAKNRG